MRAVKFNEVNVTAAENQPEYLPLPICKLGDENGTVVFCMKLSFLERLRVLFLGNVWVSLLTFNKPLTPSFLTTKKSDLI